MDAQTQALLPPVLIELTELMGLRATLTLVEHYGGIRCYVPTEMHADHPLSGLLGYRAARKLSERHAGELLSVPRAARAMRLAVERQIVREYQHKSAAQLARTYRVTERNVYRILSKHRAVRESDQMGLFESC